MQSNLVFRFLLLFKELVSTKHDEIFEGLPISEAYANNYFSGQ